MFCFQLQKNFWRRTYTHCSIRAWDINITPCQPLRDNNQRTPQKRKDHIQDHEVDQERRRYHCAQRDDDRILSSKMSNRKQTLLSTFTLTATHESWSWVSPEEKYKHPPTSMRQVDCLGSRSLFCGTECLEDNSRTKRIKLRRQARSLTRHAYKLGARLALTCICICISYSEK